MPKHTPDIYAHPAEILQNLIRFDTTNPPGNERPCIEYIQGLLNEAGIQTTILSCSPTRPNLIARLKGNGTASPLLLYGHADVVTTAGQTWSHPPFEASIVDGYVWGRGALDMKHGLAMYLAAILRAKAEGTQLPGDILFAVTVDEEVDSLDGAQFLVNEHADLFSGVRYGLTEFGGASIMLSGKRFYPIQFAEKQECPVTLTFHGKGGHGGVPVHDGAMAKMAEGLRILNQRALPVRITSQARLMVEAIASGLGGMNGFILRQLLNPMLTNTVLKLMGESASTFAPLLHNSVSPTMIEASQKINVIPAKVTLELDGRLVPGSNAEEMKEQLRKLLGEICDIDAATLHPGPVTADMGLFELLAGTLRELDPEGLPIPFVSFAVDDARFFAKLGIQTYGFTPLFIPEGLALTATIHGADERVPVAAMEFGATAVFNVIKEPRQI